MTDGHHPSPKNTDLRTIRSLGFGVVSSEQIKSPDCHLVCTHTLLCIHSRTFSIITADFYEYLFFGIWFQKSGSCNLKKTETPPLALPSYALIIFLLADKYFRYMRCHKVSILCKHIGILCASCEKKITIVPCWPDNC